ncbi:MAG: sigma-70 family RNA polymerase sigma factor [Ignavibacteriales bacterium]|nr:sigma-70 family RNA polymerase sigma factor [Ignavibacteriales bacterium]
MKSPLQFFNTDSKILDLMKKGDEEALVMLYESNRRMVQSYVARNNGTDEDAEDLLQEAVVVIWERVHAGTFEYSAKLSTFIYATVQNMWRRRLARSKRETPTEFLTVNDPEDPISFLDDLVESELSKQIAAALVKLGEPCKTLLLLFYWEECSMEEIAKKMKFANAETAKSKKYQCKKAMEEILVGMGI